MGTKECTKWVGNFVQHMVTMSPRVEQKDEDGDWRRTEI